MATVSTAPRRTEIDLTADSAGPFDVDFRVFSETELYVTVDGVVTPDWFVSGDFTAGYTDTAQITFNSVLLSGSAIAIASDLIPARDEDYLAGPNLTEKMNAELARLTAAVADVRTALKFGPDNAASSAIAAGVSAALAATYDGPNFDTLALMLEDTGLLYSNTLAGDIIYVRRGNYTYQVAASDATDSDLITAGGLKLYYKPVGAAFPQALGDVGLLTGGYPATDERATLQLCLDVAYREGVECDFRGFKYRSEGTLHRNGVKVIRGAGCDILFPSSGTYDKFLLDDPNDTINGDGSGNASDPMCIAFDVSGQAFTWEGHVKLSGVDGLNKFTSVQRALVDQNLSAIGGVSGSTAEMEGGGQIVCEGFAHWIYVPALETGLSSRQFARITGQYRSRFCLSPVGWFGGGSNGNDDSGYHLRTDRCGGYGTVTESKISGTELNCGYFFGTGLTDKTANDDWEDTTISVTHNTAAITLSGAGSSVLDVGDYISILNAYERADGSTIPLVTRIATKVSDTSFTVEAKALPYLPTAGSATELNWFYRPPRISLSAGHMTANTAYFEGHWDCLEMEDNSIVDFMDLTGGGVRLSGRHQAIINTTGLNNVIKIGAHRTLCLSNGLEAVVAYGMIRYNENKIPGDDYDAPLYCYINYPFAKTVEQTQTYNLDFDAKTGDFTEGLTVTGGTSGATATALVVTDENATEGTLRLSDISGTFVDNETITDTSTGSATTSGTPVAVDLPVVTPEVLPIKGVDPVDYFGTNRVDRFGTAITRVNVKVDWTTGEERGYFTGAGVFTTRTFVDGLSLQGEYLLDKAAIIGTQTNVVEVSTSATTIYDADTLEPGSGYRIFATSGDGQNTAEGYFSVEPDGTVHIGDGGSGNSYLTFSASTTNLRAALASGTADVRFSLVGRI